MTDTSVTDVARTSFVEVQARLEFERRRLLGLREADDGYPQLEVDLAEVDRALERLADGTYGRCEGCGNRIGEVRLRALPATRWCVLHQRGREIRID